MNKIEAGLLGFNIGVAVSIVVGAAIYLLAPFKPTVNAGECVTQTINVDRETGKLLPDSVYMGVLAVDENLAKVQIGMYRPSNPLAALAYAMQPTQNIPIEELMKNSRVVECPALQE